MNKKHLIETLNELNEELKLIPTEEIEKALLEFDGEKWLGLIPFLYELKRRELLAKRKKSGGS